MARKIPIINIFTYDLSYKLANQIYNEFDSRLREAKYIIGISDIYRPLEGHQDVIENFACTYNFSQEGDCKS